MGNLAAKAGVKFIPDLFDVILDATWTIQS
jgi:hypothetical protein